MWIFLFSHSLFTICGRFFSYVLTFMLSCLRYSCIKKYIQDTSLFLFSILRSKRDINQLLLTHIPLNDLHCFFIKFNDIPDRRLSRICHNISTLHGIGSHQFNLIFRYTNIGKMLRNARSRSRSPASSTSISGTKSITGSFSLLI